MAHTDKDDPYWVRAQNDPHAEEWHATGCLSNPLARTSRVFYEMTEEVEEVEEVRISPLTGEGYTKTVTKTVRRFRRIRREVAPRECDLGQAKGACHYWVPSKHRCVVPSIDRRLSYYGPERAHVRDTLRAAEREYNAFGETDTEPINRQARHATWAGGYWD